MRGWLCTLGACCLVIAACAAGKPASNTPTAVEVRASISPNCNDPLPAGEISFQGHVATEPAGYPYNLYITVSVDRVQAQPGTAIYGVERFVPHSMLTVVLPAFATHSPVASGDCVLGSGSVRRYQCHPRATWPDSSLTHWRRPTRESQHLRQQRCSQPFHRDRSHCQTSGSSLESMTSRRWTVARISATAM